MSILHVKPPTPKQLNNRIFIIERMLVLVYLAENRYYDKTLSYTQVAQNILHLMYMYTMFVFCMGSRLIYRTDGDADYPELRCRGFFSLLYIPHLIFSLFFGVCLGYKGAGLTIGLLLFCLKFAVLLCWGGVLCQIRLAEMNSVRTNAMKPSQNADIGDIFCCVGLCILWILDFYLLDPGSPMHTGMFFLQFALFVFVLFRPWICSGSH